jgi:putative membrane protein
MIGIIVRILINALALWLAAALIPGVDAATPEALLWAAVVLGLVNAIVRPVVVVLTLPITVLSLGAFLLVINAGMVALVGWLIAGFHVMGFVPALLAGLVVSVISWLASRFVGPKGRYEVLVIERRR